MKKMLIVWFSAAAVLTAFLIGRFNIFDSARETIIFFPIDESVSFKSSGTTLSLGKENDHSIDWKTEAKLDRKAYLRQDLALLYTNGLLKGKMGKWRQNTADLIQKETIKGNESSKVDAITFHYAELHQPGDTITSAQTMSNDSLYIIDSAFTPLSAFRVAKSSEEIEWKKVLHRNVRNKQKTSLQNAQKTHGVNLAEYSIIPLNELKRFREEPLPGFSRMESAEIIGRLWEGIYKNYFLGIRKSDGTVVEPNDSTMPLILISRDKTHLLVITETKDGESVLLKQLI